MGTSTLSDSQSGIEKQTGWRKCSLMRMGLNMHGLHVQIQIFATGEHPLATDVQTEVFDLIG